MLSKLIKIFKANIFFSNILAPMLVLLLYCVSFLYLSSRFVLEGVNYNFVSRLEEYVLVITLAASLFFLVILKLDKADGLRFKYFPEKFYLGDLLLLLLPLTPVVQYILNNQAILSPVDFLYVVFLSALFSSFYIFIVPALFGILIPNRGLIALGVAFTYTIANMASISNQFAWFEKGTLWIQLLFISIVYLAVWSLYKVKAQWLLYIFIIINFVANSSAQLLLRPAVAAGQSDLFEENKLLTLVENRSPAFTPNIYLLIYDAYVPNETMLGYGIDNSAQEQYLTTQGFVLYPHTYSTGAASIPTMSKVLNASTEYYGNERRAVSGNGVTQKILKDLGYKTYGVFSNDYWFHGYGENYDYSFPEKITPAYIQLLKAIFLGEFRFDIENIGFKEADVDQFIKTKHGIFEDDSRNRVFIFTYSGLPGHSQNSGACLVNETDLYRKRLEEANIEMRQDIDLIIKNHPDAIVIVAGDHGPYLTKNCFETTNDISEISRLDIQDRHGTFLAIRWPTADFEKYDDIVVLQDLFPAVFSYLYKDATILDAKIEPVIIAPYSTSGASVNNGLIVGGINDGEFLFLSGR